MNIVGCRAIVAHPLVKSSGVVGIDPAVPSTRRPISDAGRVDHGDADMFGFTGLESPMADCCCCHKYLRVNIICSLGSDTTI